MLSVACNVAILLFAGSGGDAEALGENAAQSLSRVAVQRDLSQPDNKALYCVGYAHLDTQWRWDFVTTIDKYIKATLDQNFERIESFPDYVFSFTGSVRYEMMKEYYPERYKRLKEYIRDGRWFVSGSSVDEGDVNVPSSESIIRQILYGNLYFEREFGKRSADFMLPDCFGFPASLPTLFSHCGLIGFSTQKLTWGSAVGIPFKVGVWEGPDGNGVIAALDPGPYVGAIEGEVGKNKAWLKRVKENGELYGVWADYHYYGVGDQGGAPKEKDVANYVASKSAEDREMDIVLASSEQLYQDVVPSLRKTLPRYKGDMLLTEHSAGTLTSQSYMKRWNRKGELLADAAERAAAASWTLGLSDYPRRKLEAAWVRILANQMHDILPGTSIPRAYRYSWNDDAVGMNLFASVLEQAVAEVASIMDTNVEGQPVVVFNPLSIKREDVVEATLGVEASVRFLKVFDAAGREVPSQLLRRSGNAVTILFRANMDPNSFAVFDVRPSRASFAGSELLQVDSRSIENEYLRATFNDAGDLQSLYDKKGKRELLDAPATLEFTYEKPQHYPAWNMDWADRQHPPVGRVDGKPQWRIVEQGPLRAALAVTRAARDSEFTQTYRLATGEPGRVLDVATTIDWQSTSCTVKAAFPFTASNPKATYNWGCGTIRRGNNNPVQYEVPSHEWFDLTDSSGEFGIAVLDDSKYGSDKPADNIVRLTLLYTPGVRGSFVDQHSQDWGIHDMRYGLYPHEGDWRQAHCEARGRRFNQPLYAFSVARHAGRLGRKFSLLTTATSQVDVRAIKIRETSDHLVIRVQELTGEPASGVSIRFPFAVAEAIEVDGQERELRPWAARGEEIRFDVPAYGLRTFAVRLAPPDLSGNPVTATTPLDLPYDTDAVTGDSDFNDGQMSPDGKSYPGEVFPESIDDGGVRFKLAGVEPTQQQFMTCRGQTLFLPGLSGDERPRTLHLLLAATQDGETEIRTGDETHTLPIQSWTGFVGQWYDRIWDRPHEEVDFKCAGEVRGLRPAFMKPASIAWFATHRHDPKAGNEAYRFSYLYHERVPLPAGASSVTFPFDERVRIAAASVSSVARAEALHSLYDAFPDAEPIEIRHVYGEEQDRVFTGRKAAADVEYERVRTFDDLTLGKPNARDDIGSDDFVFRIHDRGGRLRVHGGSGPVDGSLPRLNDGELARNFDDTERCVWYDNEGRYSVDLGKSRAITSVATYSWHRSNRAPQFFSLWGSKASVAPDPLFGVDDTTDWELIAVVDGREAGEGWVHMSRISGEDAPIGLYRHLLWIHEDVGEGTFVTEIDVDFE